MERICFCGLYFFERKPFGERINTSTDTRNHSACRLFTQLIYTFLLGKINSLSFFLYVFAPVVRTKKYSILVLTWGKKKKKYETVKVRKLVFYIRRRATNKRLLRLSRQNLRILNPSSSIVLAGGHRYIFDSKKVIVVILLV